MSGLPLHDLAELAENRTLNKAAILLDPVGLINTQDELSAWTLGEIGPDYPPILVVLDKDGDLWVEDGHHRLARAKCRDEMIWAVVLVEDDGLFYIAT